MEVLIFMKILTTKQTKLVEKIAMKNDITVETMMKKAGEAAALFIKGKVDLNGKKCVVICGKGNNGGDGYILAKKLYSDYIEVKLIYLEGDIKIPEVKSAKEDAEKFGVKGYSTQDIKSVSHLIDDADILVEAICGIGFKGEMTDELQALSILWNKSKAIKFALDIPAGIVSDSGEVSKFCFKSDYTISFISLKPAHIMANSRECCGKIVVTDIGLKQEIIEQVDSNYFLIDDDMVWKNIKVRREDSHKGDYGKLLNISGSQNMRGAAALSTLGALRVGTGIVTLASINSVITGILPVVLEAKFLKVSENIYGTISVNALQEILEEIDRSTACLIGCGLGYNNEILRIIKYIIKKSNKPLIIDADGINAISENVEILKEKKTKIILTPHIGEMARLVKLPISEIINSRYEVITKFAKEYNVTIVLKDYNTVIADETGKVYINIRGNAGLSKGGSGDILAGIIAGLFVQDIKNAPVCGVYLHSKAADKCAKRKSKYAMLPSDIIEDLCEVFLENGR